MAKAKKAVKKAAQEAYDKTLKGRWSMVRKRAISMGKKTGKKLGSYKKKFMAPENKKVRNAVIAGVVAAAVATTAYAVYKRNKKTVKNIRKSLKKSKRSKRSRK